MEILTLLSANIRRKRGSFTGIILLMLIIASALTAFLSIGKSCRASIVNALDYADAPNLTAFLSDEACTPQLIGSLRDHAMVERVEVVDCVAIKYRTNSDTVSSNQWFMRKYDGHKYPRLKDDLSGYADSNQKPKKGEIYVTQGVLTSEKFSIGDKITCYPMTAPDEQYAFEMTIAGVVVEPCNGASVIGWKQLFISDEDFDRLYAENVKSSNAHLARVYKASDCTLSDTKFTRQLNLDTGIVDQAYGAMTRENTIHYAFLFPEIIISILMVFLVFLIVIVLIVMNHSISTGIEIDYVNLGVLKAMGFSKGKIRAVFILQYLLAQFIGSAIGFGLGIPVNQIFGGVFQPILAIPIENHLAILQSVGILAAVLAISCLFILLSTRKVSRISPIRAIAGGREEIYFDSRIKAPIFKRFLSSSLALRQFTSNKRRYFGTIVIATVLVFFMLTITVLGDSVNSESATEEMGLMYTNIDLIFTKPEAFDSTADDIEAIIERHTAIKKKYYYRSEYVSIDGEKLYCMVFQDPANAQPATKGRMPLYDNEIAITPIVSEAYDWEIGDKVTLSKWDQKVECIITGYYQSLNDTGYVFATNFDCAKRIGIDTVEYACYNVSDLSEGETIKEELLAKYGDILDCHLDFEPLDETFAIAINAMKAVIYLFSVLFALVVVVMVCQKTFLQEKTDIGIYKAIGFQIAKLRLQFAVRFLIIALISAAFGAVLALWLSGRVISLLLHNIGITNFVTQFTPVTFAVPIVLVCLCFFAFAYGVSRRIKRVDIKELITE